MTLSFIDLVSDIYLIIIMSLTVAALLWIVLIYERQELNRFKELQLLMHILYADMFWCMTGIVEDFLHITNKDKFTVEVALSV